MECETEWSNNKKVVDLAGRDVRKAVPKGLPYFFVDFGMQSGYAHVIEDNRLFPTNFGQVRMTSFHFTTFSLKFVLISW